MGSIRPAYIPEEISGPMNAALGRSLALLQRPHHRTAGLDALFDAGQDERLFHAVAQRYARMANARGRGVDYCDFRDRRGEIDYAALCEDVESRAPITRLLISTAGADCGLFPDFGVWAFYWSIVVAQQRFSTLFAAQESHEERLTGHLLSEIFAASETIEEDIRTTAGTVADGMGPALAGVIAQRLDEMKVEFVYGDLSIKRQEQLTGADFGLIVQKATSDGDHRYVPIRFQAKCVPPSGKANLLRKEEPRQQYEALERSQCGYYVYYAKNGNGYGPIIPLVQSASSLRHDRLSNVDTFKGSVDLATFFLDLLLDDHILSAPSIEEALQIILAENESRPPSVILAASPASDSSFRTSFLRKIEYVKNSLRDTEPPLPDFVEADTTETDEPPPE